MTSPRNSFWSDPTTYFQGDSRGQESGSNPPSRTVPGLLSPQTFADKGIVFRRFMAGFINKKPVSRMETDKSASGSREELSLRFSELRRADESGVEQLCQDPVASIGGPDEDAPHPENQELSSASSISFLTRSEDNDVEEAETSSETTSTFEDLEDLDESQTFGLPEDL